MGKNRHKIRIIGGEYRSRMIDVIDADGLRPTSSRMRETLFNWLQVPIHGATVIDLFAGSGALGIEALSRGAKRCYFIEKDRAVYQQLKRNLTALNIPQDRYELICQDAITWLADHAAHLFKESDLAPLPTKLTLFIDPPFHQPELYEAIATYLPNTPLFTHCTDLIIEMPKKSHLPMEMALTQSFKLLREMATKESHLLYYGAI